jgi:hypothetical protein
VVKSSARGPGATVVVVVVVVLVVDDVVVVVDVDDVVVEVEVDVGGVRRVVVVVWATDVVVGRGRVVVVVVRGAFRRGRGGAGGLQPAKAAKQRSAKAPRHESLDVDRGPRIGSPGASTMNRRARTTT